MPRAPRPKPLTAQAHDHLSHHLGPGMLALDATAGNGHDTLFLAEQVGASGHVWAFDIQTRALAATRKRLEAAGLERRVTLIHAGHERLDRHIPRERQGQLRAATFNLGYLPGGDHQVRTQPDTTVRALDAALRCMAPNGVISLLVYRGHAGGMDEHATVLAWLASTQVTVERHDAEGAGPHAPVLFLVSSCCSEQAHSATQPASVKN